MKIEIVIPEAKIKVMREYFLYTHPIPKNEEDGKSTYTFQQWLKKWIMNQIFNAYRSGKKRKKWDEFSVTYISED